MTSGANFQNIYFPFVAPSPSAKPSPPTPTPWPPGGAMHNMTDEELFRWASMAPKLDGTPYHRVPKVAFMFLVRGDLPLRPLWEKFFEGHHGLYSIYVHTNPSHTVSPPRDSVFYGRTIPSQRTTWGGVTLVEAERRLLANALLDLSNERFALLSESCIPIYNFSTVYAVLTGSKTSFVESIVSTARYRPLFALRNNISEAQWRKGSQWFELDRALAGEAVADAAYFPTFRENCAGERFCVVDEHYMSTLVSVLGWGRRNANRTLTFADWDPKRRVGAHPRNHRGEEVTVELIERIRKGGGAPGRNCSFDDGANGVCFLFSRKFAPDTLQPLLRLAPKAMGFG
ncbi:hypothetical protein HU200_031467 [Digitaria exilis]|uniref:Uncharacterized protein n=1 Tax=Digitaria exilis TaxID=1010633 RepID=A0A835ER30_9POAL|nr:hypothetical protein HU200_031467 [Digitaria exilis]CAB3485260.1 unnamed protein product [Digitaria exilis]